MAPRSIFKGRKKETEEKVKEEVEEKVEKKTLLEELCKGDNELYSTLSRTLLLNPDMTKKTGETDARVERAQEYEKNKDYVRARIEYQLAGELALYEGKTAQVQKLFKKAAEVDLDYPNRSILEFFAKKENTEKAIAVAQEYYARTAKHTT